MLEYVTGGLLFDVCQTAGGMGEDGGRFFLHQMVEVLEFMQSKGVVHRDLKLENILVDDQLNLKVADFGFATYKKINKLQSYRGTMTYMAPEIKEGKVYDGKQIDMFSTGVILFIIVQGIFPFKEAKPDEYFYNLILKGKFDIYWKKVGGESLSEDFKDLVMKMVHYNPNKRPSIEEVKNHPYFTKEFNVKSARNSILSKLQDVRSVKTAATSRDEANSRGGDNMLELIRQPLSVPQQQLYKFNDMTDHDIDVTPGALLEDLNMFNIDYFDSKFQIEANIEK